MTALVAEFGKLGAFVRRDFLVALTYKFGFVSDWVGLAFSVALFYFVGKIIDPSKLPAYGGSPTTYLEFVIVGMLLSLFVQVALSRVASVMRQEQFSGTLESLLMTPTAPFTVQIGSVLYALTLIPLRMGIFFTVVAVAFGLDLKPEGILPSVVYLAASVPFVWGLGLISAGITMTFRRGGGLVELGAAFLTLGSGAYFPVDVLPAALVTLSEINPLAIAIEGMRNTLLGDSGWSDVPGDVAVLIPIAAVSLAVGNIAFRLGVRRERKRGTLGLY